MYCTECGANMPEGTKFCTSCGAPLQSELPARRVAEPTCPICGAQMPVGTKFCTQCGAPLGVSRMATQPGPHPSAGSSPYISSPSTVAAAEVGPRKADSHTGLIVGGVAAAAVIALALGGYSMGLFGTGGSTLGGTASGADAAGAAATADSSGNTYGTLGTADAASGTATSTAPSSGASAATGGAGQSSSGTGASNVQTISCGSDQISVYADRTISSKKWGYYAQLPTSFDTYETSGEKITFYDSSSDTTISFWADDNPGSVSLDDAYEAASAGVTDEAYCTTDLDDDPNWYVVSDVSGSGDDKVIWYEMVYVERGRTSTMNVSFPASQKPYCAKIVDEVQPTFQIQH